jgi:hypothetical protein
MNPPAAMPIGRSEAVETAPDLSSSAASTTLGHLRDAVAMIDSEFGTGFARAHPELVASLVQATVLENLHATGREVRAEAMALALASRVSRETNETLLKLKPRIFG